MVGGVGGSLGVQTMGAKPGARPRAGCARSHGSVTRHITTRRIPRHGVRHPKTTRASLPGPCRLDKSRQAGSTPALTMASTQTIMKEKTAQRRKLSTAAVFWGKPQLGSARVAAYPAIMITHWATCSRQEGPGCATILG